MIELPLTFSIRIVADCVALSCQVTRKLKRATPLEFTAISAIIFIHCWTKSASGRIAKGQIPQNVFRLEFRIFKTNIDKMWSLWLAFCLFMLLLSLIFKGIFLKKTPKEVLIPIVKKTVGYFQYVVQPGIIAGFPVAGTSSRRRSSDLFGKLCRPLIFLYITASTSFFIKFFESCLIRLKIISLRFFIQKRRKG